MYLYIRPYVYYNQKGVFASRNRSERVKRLKVILQIGVVLAVCLLGEVLAKWIPFPFPSSVLSMLLLFFLLFFKVLRPEHIKQKTDFMLKNMAFFFVPAGVGLLENIDFLISNGVALLVICFVSTILAFFASAYTVKGVMALQNRKKGGNRLAE